jgi:hypothetical protein
MMTIDDLIAKYRTMSTKGNIIFSQRPDAAEKSNLQYKETADYLEELKSYRENEGMSVNVYRCGYKIGYNKAVDDLTANITERFFGMAMSSGLPTEGATWENAIRQVKQIAEQLKGAKQNEDFKQEEI